jgi:hypothetical protein
MESLSLPSTPVTPTESPSILSTPNVTPDSPSKQKKLAESIDVVGSAPGTPNVSFILVNSLKSLT